MPNAKPLKKKPTESDRRPEVRLGSFSVKQMGALQDPREEWEVNKKQLPGSCFCG